MPVLLTTLILTQSFTGSFFQGDGMGTGNTFVFQPTGEVVYKFDGCFGRDEVKGRYTVNDGVLSLDMPNWDKKDLPAEFNIVHWAKTTFLIANDEMPFFQYKLRTGWRGEGKTWGLSDFLRNDTNRKVEAPVKGLAGQPVLPPKWAETPTRRKPYIVLLCKQPQFQPINGGKSEGLSAGVVLRKTNGTDLVFVLEADRDTSLVRPLLGGTVSPYDKIEPSVPAFKWRSLIRELNN